VVTLNLQQISLQVAERLRDIATNDGYAPVKTGELRKAHVSENYGSTDAILTANTPYAAAVHEGHRSFVIHRKSKHGKAFTQNMPATEGNPWLRRAAEALSREGLGFLEPALGRDVAEELTRTLRAQGLTVEKTSTKGT
jgi:hypothetical protein